MTLIHVSFTRHEPWRDTGRRRVTWCFRCRKRTVRWWLVAADRSLWHGPLFARVCQECRRDTEFGVSPYGRRYDMPGLDDAPARGVAAC